MIACPHCGARSSWVTQKRNIGSDIRRRRQCDDCGERFTTHEVIVVLRPGNRSHDKAKSLERKLRATGAISHA